MKELIELAKLQKEVSALFSSISGEELKTQDVTWQQVLILDQIKDDLKTMGEISKAIDLSYSTTSGLVDRLERENLVTRFRDKEDRRIVWVSPTKQLRRLQDTTFLPVWQNSLETKTAQLIAYLHVLNKQFSEQKEQEPGVGEVSRIEHI